MFILWPIAWAIYLVLSVALSLIGIPVCYVLAKADYTVTRKSQYWDKTVTTWKAPFWLFGNEEDGVTGCDWYLPGQPQWKRTFYWSAFRNSVNNLRFVPFFGFKADPAKIRFIGDPTMDPMVTSPPQGKGTWALTWQGYRAGFLWMHQGKKLWQFWIGWKLLPKDIHGITDSRAMVMPFATDLKRF